MSELTFDPEKHEYRQAGRVLPSVTQILRATLPAWQASEWYLQRGRALHHACRLLDEGRLDRSSVAPEIGPRVRAWERFVADSGCMVLAENIERKMASAKYGFAGTCDRVILFRNVLYVLDLKSTLAAQVAVQLGGYKLLLRESTEVTCLRAVAVELRDTGEYKAKWIDYPELRLAEQTFLSCLTVFNFMQANNLKWRTNGN